jgi:hypothetical protein
MNETNWSEWLPYDGSGQPVGDDVPVLVGCGSSGNSIMAYPAKFYGWTSVITHYSYDLDHPDAPKPALLATPEEDAAWDEKRADTIGHNGPTGEHYEQQQPCSVDGREDDLAFLAVQIAEWPHKTYTHALRKESGDIKFCSLPDHLAVEMSAFTREEISANRARIGMQPFVEPDLPKHSKYHREIKPGVFVDVYDVLHAWGVHNPAMQHLIKKALQPGERGHKTKDQDMADIVASALRARELGR